MLRHVFPYVGTWGKFPFSKCYCGLLLLRAIQLEYRSNLYFFKTIPTWDEVLQKLFPLRDRWSSLGYHNSAEDANIHTQKKTMKMGRPQQDQTACMSAVTWPLGHHSREWCARYYMEHITKSNKITTDKFLLLLCIISTLLKPDSPTLLHYNHYY